MDREDNTSSTVRPQDLHYSVFLFSFLIYAIDRMKGISKVGQFRIFLGKVYNAKIPAQVLFHKYTDLANLSDKEYIII